PGSSGTSTHLKRLLPGTHYAPNRLSDPGSRATGLGRQLRRLRGEAQRIRYRAPLFYVKATRGLVLP
ncbi:MAG: hypothetical protein ACREX9_02205, partial [Gammaproteobacteria bacterium]